MGLCEGCPKSILPDHMGRADYHGASVNQAARYMDAAAHGGQIACEEAQAALALGMLEELWGRRRAETAVAAAEDRATWNPGTPTPSFNEVVGSSSDSLMLTITPPTLSSLSVPSRKGGSLPALLPPVKEDAAATLKKGGIADSGGLGVKRASSSQEAAAAAELQPLTWRSGHPGMPTAVVTATPAKSRFAVAGGPSAVTHSPRAPALGGAAADDDAAASAVVGADVVVALPLPSELVGGSPAVTPRGGARAMPGGSSSALAPQPQPYVTRIRALRIGTFKFKGSSEHVEMVQLVTRALEGRVDR